jgi:hypothetical protein
MGFIMKEKAKKGITEIKIKEAVNITGKSRGWVIRTLQRELFKMNNQPERTVTSYIDNSHIKNKAQKSDTLLMGQREY